jgi:hypothetical protein
MLARVAARLPSRLRLVLPQSEHTRALARIAEFVSEIAELSHELLRSSSDGAQKSTIQRTRILDVVAMEERIRCFAEKSGVNCREAASRTELVARETDLGSQGIASTARKMQEMSQTIVASTLLMQQFVERVAEVDGMVATIADIARQTNLLALNAAIEAANAGKRGDGFSIIAREIRLLADRTRQSTVDIGNRIELMCSTARDAEATMLQGKLAVDESIQRTLAVQTSFRDLRDAMHRIESMSAEVAVASDRQIASVNRVTQSVQKIDSLALDCTDEADAAAEMSIRMAACARRLDEELSSLGVCPPERDRHQRAVADELFESIAAHQPQVDRALTLLQAQCAEAGQPVLRPGSHDKETLHFGAIDAEETTPWLDSISETTGCIATIFTLSRRLKEPDLLLRIATNVKRSDGSRATGTALNPKGVAARRLFACEPHHGTAYILGRPFLAAYQPVLSIDGELIGALYVGYPLESIHGA